MQKITPCLWFDGNAEEAVKFYTSVFKNSRVVNITRCGEAGPWPKGTVLVMYFQLEGQDFIALNGGKQDWKFNDAISFVVQCEKQKEIDYYWEKLLAGGGKPVQCGWLKDKYGLSWQVVPVEMDKIFAGKDKAKAQRAMQAMLKMVKLDIKALENA